MNECKSGGARRDESDFLVLTCENCFRDMAEEDESKRECLGKCENDCDYEMKYGFVPEAGCKIHDKN